MIIQVTASGDHFGLGIYGTRVRNLDSGQIGVRISLYLGPLEIALIIPLGQPRG